MANMPPPKSKLHPSRTLRDIADEAAIYPVEAFDFVQRGVPYTVGHVHGRQGSAGGEKECRHVTGRELCLGLRDLALRQWGMLAGVVLNRWNITSTLDFGRIVFHLVDAGYLRTTEDDSLEDFRNVYDFRTAFEEEYRIDFPSHLGESMVYGNVK